MNALGLSTEQLAERRLRMHAGDAAAIMAGDYRKVFRRIKFGEDEDLYLSLPYFMRKNMTREQLEFASAKGNYTEPFNLAWTEKITGRSIIYFSENDLCCHIWWKLTGRRAVPELFISQRYPNMACNLDGTTTTPQGYPSVIDAKDISRAAMLEILKYTPSGTWQATCADTDWWGLSLIVGGKWEEPFFQEVDPMYQATMIARAEECWGFIERNEEPPEAEVAPVLPPKPTPRLRSIVVPVEKDVVYDALVHQNNWLSEARGEIYRFVGTDAAAKSNGMARQRLKDLVPEDVGDVWCGRYHFKRTKAGAVTQSLKAMEKDDDGPA
jgi:hypothetical protein